VVVISTDVSQWTDPNPPTHKQMCAVVHRIPPSLPFLLHPTLSRYQIFIFIFCHLQLKHLSGFNREESKHLQLQLYNRSFNAITNIETLSICPFSSCPVPRATGTDCTYPQHSFSQCRKERCSGSRRRCPCKRMAREDSRRTQSRAETSGIADQRKKGGGIPHNYTADCLACDEIDKRQCQFWNSRGTGCDK
jgi:hypothetical protein